ncbi:MAG: site-specific DNA-methyltransferase [Patescibacteria group bacterium]|nr:site-specific DNA-methyltransferase [Patescibacteria group bacterium]
MVDYKSPGGKSYNSKKYGGTGRKIFNDNLSEEKALQFYKSVLKNLYDFSEKDVSLYWWFANRNNKINRQAWEESGWMMSQIVIWLKNSMIFSQGQDYHRCYEPCMFGWKKGQHHFTNKQYANFKDVMELEDVEQFSDMLDVWFQRRDTTNQYLHPTQKPVRLAERALRKNSSASGVVVDLFGGSGSTLIGCEQMGRKCYVMELDPKYCDVIIQRYEKFTGKKAEKIKLKK